MAAFLPGEWNLRLVDLDTSRLRDAAIRWADWVFVGGMIVHEPSVRVLRSIATALNLSVETMLVRAGLLDPDETGTGGRTDVATAIRDDPDLTEEQKASLLAVYRSYTNPA